MPIVFKFTLGATGIEGAQGLGQEETDWPYTDLLHFPLELQIGLLRLRHLPPGGRKLFLYFPNLT